DLLHGRVFDALALLLEERAREEFDARHVREVLDDGHLLFTRHGPRRNGPVELDVDVPLALAAHLQHSPGAHLDLLCFGTSGERGEVRKEPRLRAVGRIAEDQTSAARWNST